MEGQVGRGDGKGDGEGMLREAGRVQEGRGSWRSVKGDLGDAVATGVQCP